MEYNVLTDNTIPNDVADAIVNNKSVLFRINWLENINGKKDVDLKLDIDLMYKILYIKRKYKLTDINLFIFADAAFLYDPTLKEFRKHLNSNFECVSSEIKKASECCGVDPNMDILMSIWKGI